ARRAHRTPRARSRPPPGEDRRAGADAARPRRAATPARASTGEFRRADAEPAATGLVHRTPPATGRLGRRDSFSSAFVEQTMVEVACRLLGVGGFRRVEQSPNAQKLLGDLCSSAKVEPLECASPVQYRASRL